MPGEALAQGLPVAGMEGFERLRGESGWAAGAGFPGRLAGIAETVAHGRRPGLGVERDDRLEFAQMVGVAERMGGGPVGAVQLAVGFETVMDDDAPFEAFRHRAAFGADAG